jgi:hypothetical protein
MAENKKKNYAMKVRNCTTTEQYSEFISEAKLVVVMFGKRLNDCFTNI